MRAIEARLDSPSGAIGAVSHRERHRHSLAGEARAASRLVLALLAYAAKEEASDSPDRIDSLLLAQANDRQFQYVIDGGLAPLLFRGVRDRIDRMPSARRDALLSAHLTAQVRYGNLVDATTEIIDACEELRVSVTLLKGISVSDQHYPAAYLRPMGDIDLLIPELAYEAVEAALLRRGYIPRSDRPLDEGSYHGVPLLHPKRRVWVELHTALFPQSARVRRNGLFSPSQIAAQSVASTFHGRPVSRLTDELQLIYLAAYWIRDLSMHESHPSFVIPLLDAIYILKRTNRTLDWKGLCHWLDNDVAMASLYLMLAYLSRCGLDGVPSEVLPRLASGQDIVGSLELKIIHAMIDRYLIEGRRFTRLFHSSRVWDTFLAPGPHAAKLLVLPWNILFPPLSPDRYSITYQLERIPRLLRRLRPLAKFK